MTDLIKYIQVDFTKIKRVELVSFNDQDYVSWKEKTYGMHFLTDAQKRRRKEMEEKPEFFDKLKNLWLSDNSDKNINVPCCKNCVFCRVDKYLPKHLICWKIYEEKGLERRPDRVYGDFYCSKFISDVRRKEKRILAELESCHKDLAPIWFFRVCSSVAGFSGYLYDLNLKDKPASKKIGERARGLEQQFKLLVDGNEKIEIIKKLFKIYTTDNRIKFKIPDLIFIFDGVYYIVEYKSYFVNDTKQLEDYRDLFLMATNEKNVTSLWVVHIGETDNIYVTDYRRELIEKANIESTKRDIYILTDYDFITKFELQTGLSAWG